MKSLRPFEVLLLLLLLLGAVLHLTVRPDYSIRNLEFFPDMAENPGYEAQDPNPIFRDGKTLQAPDPRVVPRGIQFLPLLSNDGNALELAEMDWKKLTKAEQRDWDRLRSDGPFDVLDEAGQQRVLDRGKNVFEAVCAACHGLSGLGGTAATKRGVPPPPSLIEQQAKDLSDGRIFRIITVGQGNMQSHANLVDRMDRWKVVRHIRKLQEPKQ